MLIALSCTKCLRQFTRGLVPNMKKTGYGRVFCDSCRKESRDASRRKCESERSSGVIPQMQRDIQGGRFPFLRWG